MSYPSQSNFGDYYDTSIQGQNVHNSYNDGRQPLTNHPYGTTQASYPGDIRQSQSQYGSSGYDYARQNQQSHPNSSHQQTYNTESWKSSNGLNNLAYASGLEDPASQRQDQRAHQPAVSSTGRYPSTGATGPNRVQSPVAQGATRYNVTPSMNFSYQAEPSTMPSQQPPVSAATALAGAVNRRFPQSSASPVMGAVNTTQATSTQRSASPYPHSANTQTQTRLPANSGTPQPRYSNSSNSGHPRQQWPQGGNTGHHVRAPSQSAQPGPSRPQTQPRAQAAVNSISNLVTNPMEETSQPTYSPTVEAQNTVPDYIDPSKVFNPYHLEHERRRREAEAQSKRKAAEEAAARKKKEEEDAAAAARKKSEEEEAARKKAEEAAAALAKKKAEGTIATGHPGQASRKAPPNTTVRRSVSGTQEVADASQQPVQPPQGSATRDADTAAELKALMEKMKEYRNKDPGLFQTLWEDMRNQSQGTTAAFSAASSSPQMSQQDLVVSQNRVVAGPRPTPAPAGHQISFTSPQTTQPQTTSDVTRQQVTTTPQSPTTDGSTPGSSARMHHLNGYKVVVENNPEGLPDLGRFPAERRIRFSYTRKATTTAAAAAANTANLPFGDASAPPVASIQVVGPVNPPAPQATGPTPPTPLTFSKPVSPILSQGLPTKGAAGSTIWPEEKRNALAEAAVKSLISLPENSRVKISPADIHAMLDKNPSYIELCEMLEGKGLKFHRGHFARQLLSNVPYLNGPQAKSGQSQPQPLALSPGRTPAQVPKPPSSISTTQTRTGAIVPLPSQQPNLGQPPIPVHGMVANRSVVVQHQQPNVKPEKPAPLSQLNSQGRRTSKANSSVPRRPEPPPGSKESMARKRDFSELIDLTALNDNDDYVLSRKQPRVESPSPERDVFELYEQHRLSGAQAHPMSQALGAVGPQVPLQGPQPFIFNPGQRGLPPRVGEPVLSTRILARPINKSEALRKTYYNPKTVARDVLIAAGRHPIERPLNAHMAGLLGKHIELDSDLSTFEWDAVDPGGPPVPPVGFVDVPIQPPRLRLGQQGKRRIEPDKDKELALPDSEKRNSAAPAPHLKPEVRDVEKPTTTTLQPSTQPSAGPSTSEVQKARDTDAGTENANGVVPRKKGPSVTSPSATPLPRQTRSTRSSSTQIRSSAEPGKMSSGLFFPSGKRRGRPPGAKNLPREDVGAIKPTAKREISVTIPSPASPSLPTYKCHWKGCKARLHNLQTLRQHISKVHRPSQDEVQEHGYICWWKKCRYLEMDDEGLVHPQKAFDTTEEWLAHIEEDHLHQVAVKYGDGPSTKHIDPQTILQDRTRYLSDENGRITTPAVSEKSQKSLEPDTMALFKAGHDDAEKTAQRSFMKAHRQEKSSPKALAEETLRAMEARKAAIGPGIDKGGCVLVNEARRSTLIQNPGIRRVVDANY